MLISDPISLNNIKQRSEFNVSYKSLLLVFTRQTYDLVLYLVLLKI